MHSHWIINSENLGIWEISGTGEKRHWITLCYSSHLKKSFSLTYICSCFTEHNIMWILKKLSAHSQPSRFIKVHFHRLFLLFVFLLTDIPKCCFLCPAKSNSFRLRWRCVICSSSCLFCPCSWSCEQRLRTAQRRGRWSSGGQTTCSLWGTRGHTSHIGGLIPSAREKGYVYYYFLDSAIFFFFLNLCFW